MKLNGNLWKSIVLLFALTGCVRDWDEHYNAMPETVDENVWTAIQQENNLSLYVQYMKKFQYDTLLQNDDTYTLFIPDNDAFTKLIDTGTVTRRIMEYHIALNFILAGDINGARKIRTLGEKLALFEHYGGSSFMDGIPLETESPLYTNGKYYTMAEVANPKPNLYEYISETNPVLKAYIDRQDTLIIDYEKSIPRDFDSLGRTIYDTVSEVINLFEYQYYPVSEEPRNFFATLVFPKEEDYNAALTFMAQDLEGTWTGYEDIPRSWQYKTLIPFLLYRGVLLNMLEPVEFLKSNPKDSVKLLNILGDSVRIHYQVGEKTICSNGFAYNYLNFSIPDSLYMDSTRYEAERLFRPVGTKHTWDTSVTVINDATFQTLQEYVPTASNDSVIRISFNKGYSGRYSIDFTGPPLFPRKYLMVLRTDMRIGGLYELYVNDELVRTFDYYEFIENRDLSYSVSEDVYRYVPEGRFNYYDCWMEMTEYGSPRIRIEYKGPGAGVPSNGLVLDYIAFRPASELGKD